MRRLFCTFMLVLALALITGWAMAAEPLTLAPGEGINLSCETPGQCPEVNLPLPGNPHAAIHSQLASENGPGQCLECHRSGGEAVTQGQTMLCSQYPFRYPGIVAINPNTGNPLEDPVTGGMLISGGHIGVYDPGMAVVCRDCHYPHQSGGGKVEDSDRHAGCVDCHRNGGFGEASEREGRRSFDD